MKLLGLFLLLAGWLIVLAAMELLRTSTARLGFVIAGIGVEALGLTLSVRAHRLPPGEEE